MVAWFVLTAANSYVLTFHVDRKWVVYRLNAWDLVMPLSSMSGKDSKRDPSDASWIPSDAKWTDMESAAGGVGEDISR